MRTILMVLLMCSSCYAGEGDTFTVDELLSTDSWTQTESGILSVTTFPISKRVGDIQVFYGVNPDIPEYIEYHYGFGYKRYYPKENHDRHD